MNDLISRSALLEFAKNRYHQTVIPADIEYFPAVDAVEVVRCKDCKNNNAEKALRKGGIWCEYWGTDPDPDDFCKRGERRADE